MAAKKYEIIRDYLLQKIRSGEYVVDQAIPPERELAEQLGVNRMTVRKAIEELMYEGLLTRRMGSGTYLTKTKSSKVDLLLSQKDNVREIKVISCKLGAEGNYGGKVLELEPGTPFYRLRRVRIVGGVPCAYEDIYMNQEFFEGFHKNNYELGLYQLVKTYLPGEEVTVYKEAEALLCLQNTAALLKVRVNSPILQIKCYFEKQAQVVMFSRSYHPGDTYKFQSYKRQVH